MFYNAKIYTHKETLMMFILNPDEYLQPAYRISPFKTSDMAFNNQLPESNFIEKYLNEKFHNKKYQFTVNGREAIFLALQYYKLQNNDIVTIFTTSGNTYISNCVTNEIEKFCKWSRKIEEKTRVILINHEFGYPYTDLNEIKNTKLPIIEDCAYSFFSKDKDNILGNIGDFIIYSFPKLFPLQIGGLLVSNLKTEFKEYSKMGISEKRYVKNVLSYYIKTKDEIIEKRLNNYNFLSQIFNKLKLYERFHLSEGVVPGVFMFKKGNHQFDLNALKKYFNIHGIQCSVFYGEEAFFIPVHQALNEQDMLYFYEVIRSFFSKK